MGLSEVGRLLMRRSLFLLACCLTANFAAAQSFSFASLQAMLTREHVGSVEELLPLLPASLRQHYVLVFDSRSLQSASYAQPRVLLFDQNADFILSFNGDASQRGFNAVETMEFDSVNQQFVFREIEFPRTAGAAAVRISAPNPGRCTACHGQPPRPVWDTFPSWPGVYGENYLHTISAAEAEGLRQFLQAQAGHPRYRYLLDVDQYARPTTFNPDVAQRYSGSAAEPPNARLSERLTQLNFQAISAQLAHSRDFPRYQYALLASLEPECGAADDFLPPPLDRAFDASIPSFAAITNAANVAQTQAKQQRMHAAPAGYRSNSSDPLLQFRYLAENGLGISSRDWTLALEKSSYDFATLGSASRMLEQALLPLVAHSDPSLPELRRSSLLSDSSKYCSYLRKRSLSALRLELAPPQASATMASAVVTKPSVPATLARCVACHSNGNIGPAIAFAQPEQLAQELQHGNFEHGDLLGEINFRLSANAGSKAMPLGSLLSDSEKQALLDYFRALAH